MGYSGSGASADDIVNAGTHFQWDANENKFFVIVGTWVQTLEAGTDLGVVVSNTAAAPAVLDAFSVGSFYNPVSQALTIRIKAMVANSAGIIHVILAGADVAQVDCYAVGADENADLTASLGVVAAGIHEIKFELNSKNGASSGYNMKIQSVSVVPT